MVKSLACARVRSCPEHLRNDARSAFERRWWSLLSIAQQDALAATLVDDGLTTLDGHDGACPFVVDVIHESAYESSGVESPPDSA